MDALKHNNFFPKENLTHEIFSLPKIWMYMVFCLTIYSFTEFEKHGKGLRYSH